MDGLVSTHDGIVVVDVVVVVEEVVVGPDGRVVVVMVAIVVVVEVGAVMPVIVEVGVGTVDPPVRLRYSPTSGWVGLKCWVMAAAVAASRHNTAIT